MASESSSESVTVVISDIKSDDSLLLLVERLLNRSNLQCDSYLVSKLKEDMTIPLDVLAQAPSLSTFREPPVNQQELVERLKEVLGRSTQVSLTSDKSSVKLNFSIQRHTVIIRDIPSTVSPDEIRNLLPESFQSKISNVQSEVGNNWFVTFETEADAHEALSLIRKTKYNGKMIGARLKAESLLRGTPAVRSGPRPATSNPAVATPSADVPTAAPAASFNQPHSGFPASTPAASKPPTPGFSSFYQPGYYGSPNWYYPQGTHSQSGAVHSHDSLINTPVHSFPSSLSPASIPASAPIPNYSATYQSHSVPHSSQPFDGAQKMAPMSSPRTKSSPSSGGSFPGRAKPNSQSGQPNSQNRNKSTHTSSNPSGKRRPRTDNPSGSHKPTDSAPQSTGHPSTTHKKRHMQRGARADDAAGPRTVESHHHHAPKPVSLTARNFPPLSSGPSVSPAPASAWTKEGLNNVKTPTAKPPKVPVVQEHPQPSTPEPTPAPAPQPTAAPTPIVAAPPSQPAAVAPAPVQQIAIQAPVSQVTTSPAPTSQNFSKPNWASIVARAPGQH